MLIGIDLGTTNRAVALWQDGAPQLVPNALGKTLTSSAVSLAKGGQSSVGKPRAIPGWLASETVTRSGLTAERLAALADRDSPDRCRVEAALTQAVLTRSGRVPTEVPKGL